MIKCGDCGRFIGTDEVKEGRARHYFEPESDRGHEVSQWTCATCIEKDKTK